MVCIINKLIEELDFDPETYNEIIDKGYYEVLLSKLPAKQVKVFYFDFGDLHWSLNDVLSTMEHTGEVRLVLSNGVLSELSFAYYFTLPGYELRSDYNTRDRDFEGGYDVNALYVFKMFDRKWLVKDAYADFVLSHGYYTTEVTMPPRKVPVSTDL